MKGTLAQHRKIARTAQPCAIVPFGRSEETAIGIVRAGLARDLGGDLTTAESELTYFAATCTFLARRFLNEGDLPRSYEALREARACLNVLGLRRRAHDVGGYSHAMAGDGGRPLRSRVQPAPRRRSVDDVVESWAQRVPAGGSALVADPRQVAPVPAAAAAPAPHRTAQLVSTPLDTDAGGQAQVPAAAPGAASPGPPAATSANQVGTSGPPVDDQPPAPTPTSATPPAARDRGPRAQENRSHFLDPVGTDGSADLDAKDQSGENGPVGEENLCPECQAVLVAGSGGVNFAALVCEQCGWPPVEEAADECNDAEEAL